MTNKKKLLVRTYESYEPPPEPGYVKSKLTIGVSSNSGHGIPFYGFSDGTHRSGGPFGDLNPRYSYTFVGTDEMYYTEIYPRDGRCVYINGTKYKDAQDAYYLAQFFAANIGNTIDIWIEEK